MHSKTYNVPTPSASIRIREVKGPETPLLFFHGGPGGTDYLFKFFAVKVHERGYRPIGMIQRGCLGSPSDGPFTVEASLEDFEAVRKALGVEKIALLAHSYGGFLATAYAARYPQHIDRLMLICPSGITPGWREEFETEIFRRLSPPEQAEYDRLTHAAEEAANAEVRASLLVQRAQLTIFTYYSAHHREGKPGLASLTWRVHEELKEDAEQYQEDEAWKAGLARLTCPCAVLYGEDDVVPAQVAQDYAEVLPNPYVEGLARCGHFPWMEETAAFWEAFERAMAEGT